MRVRVKLYASLQRFTNVAAGTPIDLDLPDGSTVAALLERLQIPSDEVRIAFVNGSTRTDTWPLQPGDEVGVFPPVGGG